MDENRFIKFELTEIRNSVRKILYEVLGKHGLPDDIQYSERIDSYIEYTSLEAVEIIAYVEDEFQIEIEDELLGMEFISSIEEMADIIYQYTQEKDVANNDGKI